MSGRDPDNLMMSDDESFDYLFKIVLIGDCGTGKTCVVQRFRSGTFVERHGNTIGVDFTMKTVLIDGKRVKVCLCSVPSPPLISRLNLCSLPILVQPMFFFGVKSREDGSGIESQRKNLLCKQGASGLTITSSVDPQFNLKLSSRLTNKLIYILSLQFSTLNTCTINPRSAQ